MLPGSMVKEALIYPRQLNIISARLEAGVFLFCEPFLALLL